jgi:YegS/Rv2252/BmrU family lipid kinase
MNDTVVILNPAACGDRAKRLRTRIEAIAGTSVICATSKSGEAETLARHAVAEGYEKIVAAGGDGTIHEVVNGLAGTNASLGLLPMGTVNVFAMELGLPLHDLALCWDIIRNGKTRLVDLPNANGKHFVQLGGVGLDAQVVKETSIAFKRSFGPLSYLISAAQIAARTPPKLSIQSEDTSCAEGSFILVGNGRLYGGPFPFFKHAVIDDGRFDVVVFKQLGYLEIVKYLQDVVFSSDIRAPEIEYFQTRHLRIESEQEVPVELDGELIGNCPVEFRVQQKALRVLTPR